MNHQVKLQVLSSFEDKPGTMVEREDTSVEQKLLVVSPTPLMRPKSLWSNL